MWRSRTPMVQRLGSGCALERACRLVLLLALVCTLSACGGGGGSDGDEGAPPDDDDGLPPVSAQVVDPSEVDSGGGNTVAFRNPDAFSQSNPQLGLLDQGKFESGDSEFERPRQGLLGPLFNNGTCEGCHKKDGRGNPPKDTNGDGEDRPAHGVDAGASEYSGHGSHRSCGHHGRGATGARLRRPDSGSRRGLQRQADLRFTTAPYDQTAASPTILTMWLAKLSSASSMKP